MTPNPRVEETRYPADEDQRRQFETVFPSIVRDLKDHVSQYDMPAETLEWFEQVSPIPLPIEHNDC